MLERDLQEHLFANPQILFPGKRIEEKHKEFFIDGKRIDLLFRVDGIVYIVELKRGTVQREHIGQVVEYYGLMRARMETQGIRMILAAPSIPAFRKTYLEELGIRCVEITDFRVDSSAQEYLQVEAAKYDKAERARADLDGSIERDLKLSFEVATAPGSRVARALAHRFLTDSMEAVRRAFNGYELLPIKMGPNQDVYADLDAEDPSGKTPRFQAGGAWWAYAFGHSEEMPKNDVPNISVLMTPCGLDISVNAEITPSQRHLIKRVRQAPQQFDRVIEEVGSLHLQTWLKLQHQPRFYHWIPRVRLKTGAWGAHRLLDHFDESENDRERLLKDAASWITRMRPGLSANQIQQLNQNKNLNLAIRLVRSVRSDHSFWRKSYSEQVQFVEVEVARLRPLIDFFLLCAKP